MVALASMLCAGMRLYFFCFFCIVFYVVFFFCISFFVPFVPLMPLRLLLQILVSLALPFGSAPVRVGVVCRVWGGGRMGVCVKKSSVFFKYKKKKKKSAVKGRCGG